MGLAFNIKSLFRKTAADKDKSMEVRPTRRLHRRDLPWECACDRPRGPLLDLPRARLPTPALTMSSPAQMWACCSEHKKEALSLLVKDMPLSKRIKLL